MPGRCPSCSATVPVGAPWCSLCYADLRPPSAPPPPPPPPAPAGAAGAGLTPAAVATLPPHPILDAPLEALASAPQTPGVVVADVAIAPTWPCLTCGETVAIDLSSCPTCGAGFMAAAAAEPVLRVPGLGEVAAPSTAGKIAVMVGGTVVLTAALFALSYLFGALL